MDKKSDALLRRMIKNWVNRQRPPDNGRERLLWEAAHGSRNKIDLTVLLFRPQIKSYPFSNSNEISQTLTAWINENSFHLGIQARLS